MQLYALDDKTPILATLGLKQKNYLCPQCLNPVRLRSGPRRQPHFYHVRALPSCRQHQKSLPHLHLQLHLKSLISTLYLEKSFPQIGRIADAVWEEKKLIFEVQCSPISYEEVMQRERDYAKEGYTVVWILEEKRFNKRILSAAENYLRSKICYFFGEIHIYDQFEIIHASQRLFRGPKLAVDMCEPLEKPPFLDPPRAISLRNSSLIFRGDLCDRASKDPHHLRMKLLERQFTKKRGRFLKNLKKRYLQLLHIFLRRLTLFIF